VDWCSELDLIGAYISSGTDSLGFMNLREINLVCVDWTNLD
jgi:hypothetical protein